MSLREVLDMEYYLCNAFTLPGNSDVKEGIRSVLVDKDRNPKWRYKSIADVTNQEVDKLFGLKIGPSLKTANYGPKPH